MEAFFSCFKCFVPDTDRILENHISKPMFMLLGWYSHCNQGYYNINKLKRIKLLLIKTNYSLLVACWICISQISKMRKIHSGGLKMKYNWFLWSERKGKKLLQILFLRIFRYEVSHRKKDLRNDLNQFFAHWYCWFCLWMVSGSYVLGVSLPNTLIACIVCAAFFFFFFLLDRTSCL